jgi:hypothetical protein
MLAEHRQLGLVTFSFAQILLLTDSPLLEFSADLGANTFLNIHDWFTIGLVMTLLKRKVDVIRVGVGLWRYLLLV